MSEEREPKQKETDNENTGEKSARENNDSSSSEKRPADDARPQDEQTGEGTGSRAGEYN